MNSLQRMNDPRHLDRGLSFQPRLLAPPSPGTQRFSTVELTACRPQRRQERAHLRRDARSSGRPPGETPQPLPCHERLSSNLLRFHCQLVEEFRRQHCLDRLLVNNHQFGPTPIDALANRQLAPCQRDPHALPSQQQGRERSLPFLQSAHTANDRIVNVALQRQHMWLEQTLPAAH